jgi:hypothetical protein
MIDHTPAATPSLFVQKCLQFNRQFQENNTRPIPEKIVVPVDLVTSANLKGYYPHQPQPTH